MNQGAAVGPEEVGGAEASFMGPSEVSALEGPRGCGVWLGTHRCCDWSNWPHEVRPDGTAILHKYGVYVHTCITMRSDILASNVGLKLSFLSPGNRTYDSVRGSYIGNRLLLFYLRGSNAVSYAVPEVVLYLTLGERSSGCRVDDT